MEGAVNQHVVKNELGNGLWLFLIIGHCKTRHRNKVIKMVDVDVMQEPKNMNSYFPRFTYLLLLLNIQSLSNGEQNLYFSMALHFGRLTNNLVRWLCWHHSINLIRRGSHTWEGTELSYAQSLIQYQHLCAYRRQWHPTPVLLPGKSHGRRSLVGCSPWGR